MAVTLMPLPVPTLRAPLPVNTAVSVMATESPAIRPASVRVTVAVAVPS